jgi:hypothetical protein
MKSPYVVPWFLFALAVIVWRLRRGWRSYAHLLTFALAALAMLIVGNGLAELPLAQVVLRSIGGATALSAGYWAFFETDAEQTAHAVDEASLDLWTILLCATLVLQGALALGLLTQFANTTWFYVAYGLYGILVGGLLLMALIGPAKHRRRRLDWPDRDMGG